MTEKVSMVFRFHILVAVTLLSLSAFTARANEATESGLATVLRQHYKLATLHLEADGRLKFEAGTVLTVQRGGIMSFETDDPSIATLCPSKVRGETVQGPTNIACTKLAPVSRRAFRVSETVCVTAIDVNAPADELSMILVTCDPYNAVPKNKTSRAMVLFSFSKGTLDRVAAAKIEDVIDQTLSTRRNEPTTKPDLSTETSAGKKTAAAGDTDRNTEAKEKYPPKPANSNAKAAGDGDTGDDPDPQPGPAEPASPKQSAQPDLVQPDQAIPAAPADSSEKSSDVTKGQTIEQVIAILGQPSLIADLQTKIVYFYPNLRVFFVDGKVAEVHRIGSQE
jgi:hypothetical protein